jgi:tellurite resistance protein TerC
MLACWRDLFVLGGRQAHRVPVREALAWVLAWATLAMAFAGLMWWYLDGALGREIANRKTLEFLAGYLIEQSLSVDNMFVFVMIFGYFAVPPELQRRVLLYGVLGAIIMRATMILAGVWLVTQFSWLLYVFGAFLVVTGIKMLIFADHRTRSRKEPDPALAARPPAHHQQLSRRAVSSCARTASSGRRRCSWCWC